LDRAVAYHEPDIRPLSFYAPDTCHPDKCPSALDPKCGLRAGRIFKLADVDAMFPKKWQKTESPDTFRISAILQKRASVQGANIPKGTCLGVPFRGRQVSGGECPINQPAKIRVTGCGCIISRIGISQAASRRTKSHRLFRTEDLTHMSVFVDCEHLFLVNYISQSRESSP